MRNDLLKLTAALAFVLLAAAAQAPPEPKPAEVPQPGQAGPASEPQPPQQDPPSPGPGASPQPAPKKRMTQGPDGRMQIEIEGGSPGDLLPLLDRLARIRPDRPNRLGWPPADLCPACEESWQLLHQVFDRPAWEKMAAGGPQRSQVARSTLCQNLQRLARLDLSEMDRRFGYYRWTRTRGTIDASLAKLRDPVFQELCR